MQIFQALEAPPTDPRASGSWGLCPSPPQLRISSYAPATLCNVYNYMGVGSFYFEQFFLHRTVANLMMLTVDVSLMLNRFLVEKFYLHYAVCDFDSILLHCTKLFIRQSIDREKIFDVTFENPPALKNPAYATECCSQNNRLRRIIKTTVSEKDHQWWDKKIQMCIFYSLKLYISQCSTMLTSIQYYYKSIFG